MSPRQAPKREQPSGVTVIATRDIPLADLRRFPGNARRGDVEQIRASVRRLGQYRSLVVRQHDGTLTILAGNHTADALEAEGYETARCELVECSDDEARRVNLADNRMAELGGYDDQSLAGLLAALDGDFEGTGWTIQDLDELADALGRDEPAGGSGDPDDVPEPPGEPVTRPGDLWLLGDDHRLLCGDATDSRSYARLLEGEPAALLVTDPPYGVSYAAKNRFLNALAKGNAVQEPILGDHQKPEEMSQLWNAAFKAARDVLRPGAPYYVTGPQGGDLLLLLLLLSLKESGFPLRHMLIWAKNNHVLGRSDYHYKHEPIIYGWVEGSHKFYGGTGAMSLWEIDKPLKSDLHPTMKPVELFARAIRNSSEPGDVVLDPFSGSGTAVIACQQEGRRARMLELSEAYTDVICRRIETYAGITPQRVLPDGTTETVTFLAADSSDGRSPSHRAHKDA